MSDDLERDPNTPDEGRSSAEQGGNLRAAVLGANDGLLSNFSLVMGVAGGSSDPTIVLLAGIAGLLAGAFSMAVGEWISVSSQVDFYRSIIARESDLFDRSPDRQRRSLADIYVAKGLDDDQAEAIADAIMRDRAIALDTKVREEHGLDPDALGSPFGAAFSSFTAFSIGAIVPILPYLVGPDDLALPISAVLSAVALAAVGALVARISGRNMAWGGARMLLAGGAAAAATFAIGSLIGVAISG